jgi:hypothetical protein
MGIGVAYLTYLAMIVMKQTALEMLFSKKRRRRSDHILTYLEQ